MNNKSLIGCSLLMLFITSCSLLNKPEGVLGPATRSENKIKENIQLVNDNINDLNVERLSQIGEFSYGIDYALPDTNVVKELNERITALAEKPSLEDIKEIKLVVDALVLTNQDLLVKKDKEINELFKQITDLKNERKKQIKEYVSTAEKTAEQRDDYKSTINKLNSWGGLGAIFYGISHLIVRLAWVLGIGSILFFVLRFFAASNPFLGTIFAVFEHGISFVFKLLISLFPRSLNYLGYVKKE